MLPLLSLAQLMSWTGVDDPLWKTSAAGRDPHSTPVAGAARTTPSSYGGPYVSVPSG